MLLRRAFISNFHQVVCPLASPNGALGASLVSMIPSLRKPFVRNLLWWHCFRLVKTCPVACASQPSLSRCIDVRPPRVVPVMGNGRTVHPGIHLAPRPNESPLRETFSSGGIGIVTAGDSGLFQAPQNLSSCVRFPTVEWFPSWEMGEWSTRGLI